MLQKSNINAYLWHDTKVSKNFCNILVYTRRINKAEGNIYLGVFS